MGKRLASAQPKGWAQNLPQRDPSARAIARAAISARTDLAKALPSQSAKRPAGRIVVAAILALSVSVVLGTIGATPFQSATLLAGLMFAGLGLLRAFACLTPAAKGHEFTSQLTLEAVPMWTILIALYKEADSVGSLLAALKQIEWARDRLDIIFACESDDTETLAVLQAHRNNHRFRIIRVPAGGPRTKPNALQTALPFALGRYLTVYDAEDRPHPQQLRAAFQAFLSAPPDLAVVQAPLVTWNHDESWIARQFALDYAIWFRVMLPAFARVSGLIPLGGTSNHFKTDILRKVGGWDPYNVTEDADLGVRMGRQGYQTSLITPPTYEEAPPKLNAWVKQRGRWIQGHIQTLSLHLRTPIALYRDIGWRGILALTLGIGTGPMSAFLGLPALLGLAVSIASKSAQPFTWLPFALGILGHWLAAMTACQRDGRWSLMQSALTLPFYHCLQSVAACRAMWRVVFTPSFWDKTDHGCAARAQMDKGKAAWIGQQLL
jgi:glycosyltransferase XagB